MKKKIQKPFNVEAAKNGATVETRSGRSARIICYNKKGSYPIVALVAYGDDETYFNYNVEGKYIRDRCSDNDLVIVEEVEYPKFQVGAFIVFNGNVYEVSDVDDVNNLYYFQNVKSGFSQKLPTKNIDNICNRWNTNDARPGDVLIDYHNKPFIFKGYTDKEHPGRPVAYCGINSLDVFTISSINYYWSNEHVRPATYKERQQFFNRLKEEDYKWDEVSLTLSKIQKRWRDNEKADVNGYYIDDDSLILAYSGHNGSRNHNVFVAVKQSKSALAMARISQIMANDERFGGIVTDEEWCNIHLKKFVIKRLADRVVLDTAISAYNFLAFHTKEQAELFLEENEDLIKDYYILD